MFLLLEKDNFFICFIHIFILFAIDTKSLNLPFILEAISLNLTLTLTITSFQMNQNRNESPLVSSSPSLFFFLRRLLLKSDIVWHQLDKTYNPLVFSLSLSSISSVKSLFFSKHNTQKKNHTGSSNYYSFFFILVGGWIEINRSTFYTVARIQHPSLVYWTPRFVFVPPDHHIFFSSLYEIPYIAWDQVLRDYSAEREEELEKVYFLRRSANIYREDRKSPIYHSFIFSVEGWLVLL